MVVENSFRLDYFELGFSDLGVRQREKKSLMEAQK